MKCFEHETQSYTYLIPKLQELRSLKSLKPLKPLEPLESLEPLEPLKPLESLESLKPLESLDPLKPLKPLAFPKCFYASDHEALLIMENLKAENFDVVKKKPERE